MDLPEKLRSGPFPNRAGLSSSTEMDKGSDKSKHLGNRCEEERRTNPPIQGIQTGDPRLFGGLILIERRAFLLKPLVARINLFLVQTPTFQTPS